MILFSSGVGLLIDFWKIKKAMQASVRSSSSVVVVGEEDGV